MDVRKLFPEDIVAEEDRLTPIFFSRPQDESWEDFCEKFASERYNKWLKARYAEQERNIKNGLFVN